MNEIAPVRNVWYMAAWSSEVADQPLGRRILGTPLVLYRGASGTVAALEDRCCHRGLPLALGRVIGDQLQCGYHGLCFDASGVCVRVPGQDVVPSAARVPGFAAVEQDAIVWVWMGEHSAADVAAIPRFARHTDPNWTWRGEHFVYKSDHLLLYDNLLDLTHVGYVHPNTLGGDEEAHSAAEMKVDRSIEGRVKGVRWMRNVEPPQAYQALRPFVGRIDRCQVMLFQPGAVFISILAKDVGTARDENDTEDNAYESHSFHGVTPESNGSCHYFWSVGIPSRFDRPGLIDRKVELTRITFEEDRQILEAQYARRMEDPARPLVNIRGDALGVAARRIWQQLADREAAARLPQAPHHHTTSPETL